MQTSHGISGPSQAVAAKRVIAWRLAQAIRNRHIPRNRLAQDVGTSRSQLDRLLDPENTKVQLTTITRAACRVGMRLRVELEPIPDAG